MSTASVIGTVWFNPASSWMPETLAEVVVHETTHALIFLDEIRHIHIDPTAAMEREMPTVPGAVSSRPLPLPTAVHSAMVAAELLEWRRRFSSDFGVPVHGSTEKIITNARQTFDLLQGHRDFYTPRLLDLLDRTGRALALAPA